MRLFAVSLSLLFSISSFAFERFPFPISPDARLTPGSLCAPQDSTERRYPEGIFYCDRAVGTARKQTIIKTYDIELGYEISSMNRQDFKIDHYIPLCMGGSNETTNLWPQHKSVYFYTDRLEEALCTKMREGRLVQARAIDLIREAKADPARNAPRILQFVLSL